MLGAVACALAACQFSSKDDASRSEAETSNGMRERNLLQQESDKADAHTGADARRTGVDRNAVLLENSARSEFDGKAGDEVFRVVLMGDSILSGTVAFTISNGEGDLIYSDEFPAIMLAATYDESVNTPEKQEAHVKKRIEEFFASNRFKARAIEGGQPPHDAFYVDEETYQNLQETGAPGFLYVIGKENTKHIAWSPAEQKVVMYFNCC